MTYGIVYRAYDTSNGKSYVGQTTTSLEQRKLGHSYAGSTCTKFRNALRKRPDAFEWAVLTTCENLAELNAAEEYWIDFFECVADGYNLKFGGGSSGRASNEVKQKISRGTKRAWEEGLMVGVGEKVSSSMVKAFAEGRIRPSMLGRKHSPETLVKMRASAKRVSNDPAVIERKRRGRVGM